MRVLDRYIVACLGRSIALSLAVLLALGGLFLFVNEQGWVGAGRYGQLQALRYVMLQLPSTGLQFLPVAALLGALLAMGQLARDSEITAMRAAGLSIARLAGSVAMAGAMLSLLALLAGEWLAPPLAETARLAKAVQREGNLGLAHGAAWQRDGQRLLRVEGQGAISVYELDDAGHLAAVTGARAATAGAAGEPAWTDVVRTEFSGEQISHGPAGSGALGVPPGAGLLAAARVDPRQQSLSGLHAAIRQLQLGGQDALRQRFAFWSQLARLAAIPLAMLLAVPLMIGRLGRGGTGARVAVALLLGLVYFILQRIVENGALAFGFSPLLLAWLPTLLLAGAVTPMLWRTRRLSVA